MILNIICIFIVVLALGIIVNIIINNIKKEKYKIYFDEYLNIVEFPVVTIYIDNMPYNMVIDTGCTLSTLSKQSANSIGLTSNNEGNTSVGADGNIVNVDNTHCMFTLKGKVYHQDFQIREDLDDAFRFIYEQDEVQLHGFLGTDFLNPNNYIIDYNDAVIYKK